MRRRHLRLALALCLLTGMALSTRHRDGARAAGVALFPPGGRPVGYKLGVLATACWMGGVWSDAEGVPPADWRARDDQRCHDLVTSVYGRFDQIRYEKLRATEAEAVRDLLAKVRATEPATTRDGTTTLFRYTAAAVHETMLARRAADRVKIDYDSDAVEARLTDDQRAAARALDAQGALEPLLVNTDSIAADRHVLGLLLALDRMEMARGLPKQLKLHALGPVFTQVFGIALPPQAALRLDAAPRPGAWLAYLSGAAERAGYPVPVNPALSPKSRETLAWTGVGRGFAEQLDRYVSQLPAGAVPELARVGREVVARLQSQRNVAEQMTRAHAEGR